MFHDLLGAVPLTTWAEALALALLLWFGTRPLRRLALNRLSLLVPL